MTSLVKIQLDSATNEQLRYYAGTVLGLDEIKKGQTADYMIGKIMAVKPDVTEIEVPEEMAIREVPMETSRVLPAVNNKTGESLPAQPDLEGVLHPANDPRVTITVQGSADPTKPQECFIAVNGYVIRIKRGVNVAIPLRHFLALQNGIEMVARETGEISQMTGMPVMDYSEQPSYPYSVIEMPAPELVARWHARTDGENRKKAA